MEQRKGYRDSGNKVRLDLLPAQALEEIGKVMTVGAAKYNENNWRKGLPWSKEIIGPMMRHLSAIQRGEDYDPETGLLHAAHLGANVLFLLEFYHTHPELDDRWVRPTPRIGLDIDGVLSNWTGAFCQKFGHEYPKYYDQGKAWSDDYQEILGDYDFWLNIQPLITPDDIPFEPVCYITTRPIPVYITEQWLWDHKFPMKPVLKAMDYKGKADMAKKQNLTYFVDDDYKVFQDMTSEGLCCFLMDALYNRQHNVGFKRIYKLMDLFDHNRFNSSKHVEHVLER